MCQQCKFSTDLKVLIEQNLKSFFGFTVYSTIQSCCVFSSDRTKKVNGKALFSLSRLCCSELITNASTPPVFIPDFCCQCSLRTMAMEDNRRKILNKLSKTKYLRNSDPSFFHG